MSQTSVYFDLPPELADGLPDDPGDRAQVLELGPRQRRTGKALEAFAHGECSLAFAAERAGVPLREMIPLAYAHGLEPDYRPAQTPRSRGRWRRRPTGDRRRPRRAASALPGRWR